MVLQKTAFALQELQPGSRRLPQRARSVLLLAGGKSLDELRTLLGSELAALAVQLVEQGYLQFTKTGTPTTAAAAVAPSAAAPVVAAAVSTPQAADAPAPVVTPGYPQMAGMRMYLFDLCERMFANRHEALAQSLRAQLREARDLPTLRQAGWALLDAVQAHAGQERATSLRQQLALLLDGEPTGG